MLYELYIPIFATYLGNKVNKSKNSTLDSFNSTKMVINHDKKNKHTLLLVRFMGDNIQGISSIKAPLTEYMHTTYMIDTCAH